MNDVTTSTTIIKDDEYKEITDEFEQIRSAVGMYISKRGTEGALHLLKEVFNNAIDESVNPESLGKKIDVTFDEVAQTFSVSDYSRGIPFERMIGTTMKKHSGTKFVRQGAKMKDQCGRNGVGLTVTVALCEYFAMVSYRLNQSKKIEFFNGQLKESPVENLKKESHGLCITFKPCAKYLEGEVNVTMDMVEDYLRKMSYILPSDIKVKLFGFSNEAKVKDPKAFEPDVIRKYERTGLAANVQHISTTLEFQPVEIVNITDNFDIEVAFAYDKTLDECIINSYCNYVITTEGGYHETVAQRAICDFFVRESKKLDPNSKYEVTYEDCKAGLIIAVNCKHIDPAYEGQHKSRVSNKDVLDDGKKGLNDALYKYFNYNNALLRKIINFLRQNVRARLEAHKIKGVVTKKQTTFLDDSSIPGFYPLSDRNYSGYTELIIAEGDSAGNAINKCRNSRYQAIYATMGVVDNVYGLSVKQMMDKPIFRNLTTILGCGVGSDFDINKLKYSKIIMEADADADGNNISSLVFVYFITFMPQLILQGKLYKALPPLLRLNPKVSKWYKGSLWLFNKEEYYDIINKIISENTEVALVDEETDVITSMNKREMIKWLELNSEYLTELDRLEKRTACNPTVLEYICYYKLITATEPNELKFKSLIEAKFTELRYDIADRNLVGSFNGEFISTVIDSLFMKISKKFISILADNPTIQIYCKNRNESNDKFELMSIGGFLALMDRTFEVKIEQRYKGLGEAGSEILFITTLNPKVRKLVRFTIEDMKSTLETFELLHAKNDVMRQKRRDLLDNSTISLMDLDN